MKRIEDGMLVLTSVRVGTHNDLFGKREAQAAVWKIFLYGGSPIYPIFV